MIRWPTVQGYLGHRNFSVQINVCFKTRTVLRKWRKLVFLGISYPAMERGRLQSSDVKATKKKKMNQSICEGQVQAWHRETHRTGICSRPWNQAPGCWAIAQLVRKQAWRLLFTCLLLQGLWHYRTLWFSKGKLPGNRNRTSLRWNSVWYPRVRQKRIWNWCGQHYCQAAFEKNQTKCNWQLLRKKIPTNETVACWM